MTKGKVETVGVAGTVQYVVEVWLYGEPDTPIQQLFVDDGSLTVDVSGYAYSILRNGVSRDVGEGVTEVIPPHSIRRVTYGLAPDATDA